MNITRHDLLLALLELPAFVVIVLGPLAFVVLFAAMSGAL